MLRWVVTYTHFGKQFGIVLESAFPYKSAPSLLEVLPGEILVLLFPETYEQNHSSDPTATAQPPQHNVEGRKQVLENVYPRFHLCEVQRVLTTLEIVIWGDGYIHNFKNERKGIINITF